MKILTVSSFLKPFFVPFGLILQKTNKQTKKIAKLKHHCVLAMNTFIMAKERRVTYLKENASGLRKTQSPSLY